MKSNLLDACGLRPCFGFDPLSSLWSYSCTFRCTFLFLLSCAICIVRSFSIPRGKSLLELWVTTFLPDWQLPLIFVKFISNCLCMCSNSDFEVKRTKIKGGCQSVRKVVTHNSKSDLPLYYKNVHICSWLILTLSPILTA